MKVKHYGEIISFITEKPLLAYVEFGSYQGDYIAVIDDGENVQLFKGYYGSCSGCDWLEANKDWNTGEVNEEDIRKTFTKETKHPFATIPKETIKRVDAETFTSFLPMNVRSEMYDFDGAELHREILKTI